MCFDLNPPSFQDLAVVKAKYDLADFDAQAKTWESLKWRFIQMPGGATKRPDDFYMLYGLAMQVYKPQWSRS